MAKGNHSFTEQEIRKRFGAIIGHTVAEVDTARYSKEHIIETCERLRCDIDLSRLPEPEECLDDMARAAESALEENKENNLEGEHKEEIPL